LDDGDLAEEPIEIAVHADSELRAPVVAAPGLRQQHRRWGPSWQHQDVRYCGLLDHVMSAWSGQDQHIQVLVQCRVVCSCVVLVKTMSAWLNNIVEFGSEVIKDDSWCGEQL
jgi:hypothetical protein